MRYPALPVLHCDPEIRHIGSVGCPSPRSSPAARTKPEASSLQMKWPARLQSGVPLVSPPPPPGPLDFHSLRHRLPARSPVRHPSSQAPPSPAFNTRTTELPGTPGLRQLMLSCGWSQTLACDGAGHQFSLQRLFIGRIPALIHREVHTIAYEPRC